MKYFIALFCVLLSCTAHSQDFLISKTKYDTLQKRLDSLIAKKEDTSKTIRFFNQAAASMTSTSRRIIADTIFTATSISAGIINCNISRFGYTNPNSMNVQATVQGNTPVVLCQVADYTTSAVSFSCYNIVAGIVTQLTTLNNLRNHIRIDGY